MRKYRFEMARKKNAKRAAVCPAQKFTPPKRPYGLRILGAFSEYKSLETVAWTCLNNTDCLDMVVRGCTATATRGGERRAKDISSFGASSFSAARVCPSERSLRLGRSLWKHAVAQLIARVFCPEKFVSFAMQF